MKLSNDLISQFVKVTNDSSKAKKETTIVYGTAKESDGKTYVQIDGSETLTPISMTTDAKDGDRVMVTIKNHVATITGNITSPSARKEVVDEIKIDADKVYQRITEFEIAIGDKVDVEQLNAESARIDTLVTENINIKDRLTAVEADIETLNVEELIASKAEIDNLKVTKLDVEVAEATYATIESLNATDAKIYNIENTYLKSIEADIETLTSTKANIAELDAAIGRINTLESESITTSYLTSNYLTASEIQTTYLTATQIAAEYAKTTTLESEYANINLANVSTASIGTVLAKAGLISSATIVDGHVTGYLDSVEVNANNITAGTLSVDRLVFSGTDKSIVYQLNNIGELTSTEVNTINGDVITKRTIAADHIMAGAITANEIHSSAVTSDKIAANAVTASKINVTSLESIVAKIGSFTINNALYTNNHSLYNSSVEGVYIGSDYISTGSGGKTWFKADGSASIGSGAITYNASTNKLNIDASSIKMGSESMATLSQVNTAKNEAISTAASDATTKSNTAKQAAIDSVNTTLKNYATISVTDNKISSAVSASETTVKKYADDKATTAETNAKSYTDQKAESITSTVSSTAQTLDTRVTSAESSITQLSNKITANVTETTNLGTRTSTLEQTATGLTARLDTTDSNVMAASETATNYLSFSDAGLVVGDMTASTLGKNVLIDSDSVDICNGTTTLASFAANRITLGNNDKDSVIDLCNGAGTITAIPSENGDSYPYADGLVMSSTELTFPCERFVVPSYRTTSDTVNDAELYMMGEVARLTASIQYIGPESRNSSKAGVSCMPNETASNGRLLLYAAERSQDMTSVVTENQVNIYPSYTNFDKPIKVGGVQITGTEVQDSGWKTASIDTNSFVLYNTSENVKYRKIGKMVEVNGVVKPKSAIAGSTFNYTIFTLPTGYRPHRQVSYLCQGSGSNSWLFTITAAGDVRFSRYNNGSAYVEAGTGTWLPFNATFFID